MSSNREAVAARLRKARENAGLSQAQVATKVGMHRPTISEIEAGRRGVPAEELKEFAKIYKVSVSWLLGEKPGSEDSGDERVRLAARELARMKPADLDKVLEILTSIRQRKGTDEPK